MNGNVSGETTVYVLKIRVLEWGYSSVVEHSTADREVPGSNPGAPSLVF